MVREQIDGLVSEPREWVQGPWRLEPILQRCSPLWKGRPFEVRQVVWWQLVTATLPRWSKWQSVEWFRHSQYTNGPSGLSWSRVKTLGGRARLSFQTEAKLMKPGEKDA